MTRADILKAVDYEVSRSTIKHGPTIKIHEAYGILAEEVAEFFDEVRAQKLDKDAARKELIHIASVAVKTIECLL